MPKKSRRNRAKGGTAASGGSAGPRSGVQSNEDWSPSSVSSKKIATWLYQWTPLKEALVTDFIGELASERGVDRKFDRKNVPLPLRMMIENVVGVIQSESSGDDSCIGVPREIAIPIGLGAIRQFYRGGFRSPLSLEKCAGSVEGILRMSDSLVADGQDDTAVALLAYGLRIPQTKDFQSVFLVKWNDYYLRGINRPNEDFAAFRDENANRALRFVSNNQENPMHVRAFAMVLRAFTVPCWRDTPSTVAASYFRRALVYEQNIQPGEICLPKKMTVRPFKSFTAETVKNTLQLNTDLAKKRLLVYQGTSWTDDTAMFGHPLLPEPNMGRSFREGEFQTYLTTGGAQCDHCGKTAEEAGLPCLHKCKQCRMAFYCSVECQAARWSSGGHREHCKKFGRFGVGDKLVLFGLKKRNDLNTSLVEVFGKSSPDRLNVRICYPPLHEGTAVAAKKTNLRHHRPMK